MKPLNCVLKIHNFGVAPVQTDHIARVKSLLLPWRWRQRSPLDRRMEQETRGGAEVEGLLIDSRRGGDKYHTLRSLAKSGSRYQFGMQMKRVAVAHPCSALLLPLVCSKPVGYSEPPSRNGVAYQEKQHGSAAGKRSEATRLTFTVRRRLACFTVLGVTVGTRVSHRVCLCVSERVRLIGRTSYRLLGAPKQQQAAAFVSSLLAC